MGATLTHSLAKNVNMWGINGKIGFQHLQLKDVVIGKFGFPLTSLSDVHFFKILFVMAGFTLQALMQMNFLPMSDFWKIVFQRQCAIIVSHLEPRTKK